MIPYYADDFATIYHGDCRDVLPALTADVVVTDPPYPNNAGHFTEAVGAAESVLRSFTASHWFVFWHPLQRPPVPLPFVGLHAWHRTNTNRPDSHPTQKNVKLMRRLLSFSDGVVLDPFMGSGTTSRAAKDLGRRSIGIEIEERYCEIAAKRLGQEVLDFGGVA